MLFTDPEKLQISAMVILFNSIKNIKWTFLDFLGPTVFFSFGCFLEFSMVSIIIPSFCTALCQVIHVSALTTGAEPYLLKPITNSNEKRDKIY